MTTSFKKAHSHWPGNARIAINFVLNYEEGAERNVQDGDIESESYLTGFPGFKARQRRHESCESFFRYGAGAGCERLLNLFDEYAIPITLFACGLALERNPVLCSRLAVSEHEIAGHGWRWIDYQHIPEAQERNDIDRTIKAVSSLTDKKIRGWYTGRKSLNTRKLLIEAGLDYDSEAYDADLPYYLQTSDKYHLVLPYRAVLSAIVEGLQPLYFLHFWISL